MIASLLRKVRNLHVDGPLDGVTVARWLAIVRRHRLLSSESKRWLIRLTLISLRNSALRSVAEVRYGASSRRAQVRAPIFILGYWRSGTTLLHDLFCQDPRLGWPNHYQVFHPHTFLLTEERFRRSTQGTAPVKRPQDNVLAGPFTAAEDEFALVSMTRHALYHALVFPEHASYYQRYLSLESLTPGELALWKTALNNFLRRVSLRHQGRPLVLKSPGHTSRIRTLLELYPDARFVKIHRNPFEVFQSTLHTAAIVSGLDSKQLDSKQLSLAADTVIEEYRHAHEAFFAQRSLIPPGRYCEVAYAELARDPLGEMQRIYGALGLEDFSVVEPAVRAYVGRLAGYSKNKHVELSPELAARIGQAWRRSFEEWGYPLQPATQSAS